jgi:hypothetical protein
VSIIEYFELTEEEEESVKIESDVKKQVHYYKRKGVKWIEDTEMANSGIANELFCNAESNCIYNNDICNTTENAASRMKKIANFKFKWKKIANNIQL